MGAWAYLSAGLQHVYIPPNWLDSKVVGAFFATGAGFLAGAGRAVVAATAPPAAASASNAPRDVG